MALLDRRQDLPPHAVARCRAAAERVRSVGESALAGHPEAARRAAEVLRSMEGMLAAGAASESHLGVRISQLEEARTALSASEAKSA